MRALLCPLIMLAGMLCILASVAAGNEPPTADQNLLKAVIIQVPSSLELSRLRQMPVDIVRVRPDRNRKPDDQSLSGGFIVEAVVTAKVLSKLKRLGYQVTESLPKSK
jgi:hypothetical protein